MKTHSRVILCLLLLPALVTVACSGPGVGNAPEVVEYDVDPLFEGYYKGLGGREKLGSVLTPLLQEGEYYYQYTQAVVMLYDPQAPYLKHYQLFPVGQEMGIKEPPEELPINPEKQYINGFVIWDEIEKLYNQMGREMGPGLPLTPLMFDEETRCYEQFFEGAGFQRCDEDAPGEISLISYGSWKCGIYCEELGAKVNIPIRPPLPSEADLLMAEEIFNKTAQRFGEDLTGRPLTSAYMPEQGRYEKIYENLVLTFYASDGRSVQFVPVTQSLRMPLDPPVVKEEGVYFHEEHDGLGYNVSKHFYNYIVANGNFDNSGYPITQEYHLSDMVTRQCFENLCLEYHPQAPEALRIRPWAIGYVYKKIMFPEETSFESASASDKPEISVEAWVADELLPVGKEQEIGVAIFENGIPVKDVDVILKVTLPDGEMLSYHPLPTGKNGQTRYKLAAFDLDVGTIVPYQVCIMNVTDPSFCVRRTFRIWFGP